MVPILVAVLFVGSCIFVIIAVTRASRKSQVAPGVIDRGFQDLGARLGGQVTNNQLTFTHGGREFSAKLVYAGKNQPPTLSVSTEVDDATRDAGESTAAYRSDPRVKVVGRPEVLVRKETKRDRLGKQLRINREVETGDAAFDNDFYIESYATDDDVKKVLGDARARAAATRVLAQGFTAVVVNKEVTRLSAAGSTSSPALLDPAVVERAAAALAEMALALPLFEGRARVRQWSPMSVGAMITSTVATLAGLVGYAVSQGHWRPLDVGPGWTGFSIGMGAFVVLAALVAVLVRGHSDSFRSFLVCFFILLFGAPVTSMGLTVALNGALDEAQLTDHETMVLRKWTTTSRNSTTYYLALEDWKPEGRRIEIPVDSKLYADVSPGVAMIATTGPGRFGWEWLRWIKPRTLQLFEPVSRPKR